MESLSGKSSSVYIINRTLNIYWLYKGKVIFSTVAIIQDGSKLISPLVPGIWWKTNQQTKSLSWLFYCLKCMKFGIAQQDVQIDFTWWRNPMKKICWKQHKTLTERCTRCYWNTKVRHPNKSWKIIDFVVWWSNIQVFKLPRNHTICRKTNVTMCSIYHWFSQYLVKVPISKWVLNKHFQNVRCKVHISLNRYFFDLGALYILILLSCPLIPPIKEMLYVSEYTQKN